MAVIQELCFRGTWRQMGGRTARHKRCSRGMSTSMSNPCRVWMSTPLSRSARMRWNNVACTLRHYGRWGSTRMIVSMHCQTRCSWHSVVRYVGGCVLYAMDTIFPQERDKYAEYSVSCQQRSRVLSVRAIEACDALGVARLSYAQGYRTRGIFVTVPGGPEGVMCKKGCLENFSRRSRWQRLVVYLQLAAHSRHLKTR